MPRRSCGCPAATSQTTPSGGSRSGSSVARNSGFRRRTSSTAASTTTTRSHPMCSIFGRGSWVRCREACCGCSRTMRRRRRTCGVRRSSAVCLGIGWCSRRGWGWPSTCRGTDWPTSSWTRCRTMRTTTAMVDALWAGLPVLTRLGETFAGRVAASLLTAIDLPEARSPETPRLPPSIWRSDWRAIPRAWRGLRLRVCAAKPGRDGAVRYRGLHAPHRRPAYTAMYERHHAGLPP